MSTFQQNDMLKKLGSPDLAADTQGMRTHVVPEGIVIETSQVEISLLATHIDDRNLLEANRDGVSSYKDIETIILTADLLANDTLAGFLDANGFVHSRLDGCFWYSLRSWLQRRRHHARHDLRQSNKWFKPMNSWFSSNAVGISQIARGGMLWAQC